MFSNACHRTVRVVSALSSAWYAIFAFVLLFSAPALAETRWDMPTGYAANNFHTENLQRMADDVDKATQGRLKIVLHPNGALFKANEIKKAVQSGQAQIGEVLMSNLASENVVLGVDSVPFLATSYADALRLWQASKPVLAKLLEREGLMLTYAVPWPPQGIYVNKPLNSSLDMKGLKWRAYNAATTRIAELVNAQPVTIQAAELSQALSSGKINSFMSSSATGVDTKVWESLTHFYTVNAWLPKNMVIVNRKAFEALDRGAQTALLSAIAAAEQRGWKVSEEKNKGYLESLTKNQMQVLAPAWRFKLDMNRVGRTMVGEWLQTAVKVGSSDGKVILDEYLRSGSQTPTR